MSRVEGVRAGDEGFPPGLADGECSSAAIRPLSATKHVARVDPEPKR